MIMVLEHGWVIQGGRGKQDVKGIVSE